MKNFLAALRHWYNTRHTLELDDLVGWLQWEIRLLDPSILLPGDNGDTDIVVSIVADQLIGASTDDVASLVAKHQSRIDTLQERAYKDDLVRMILSWVCLSRHAGTLSLGLTTLADKHLAQARVLDRNAEPLDKTESRRLKGVLRKRIREVRREIADRKGFSFPSVTPADIAGLAAFASVLLLCAGYFQITFLLQSIGLNASLYFSITDYLAATANSFWIVGFAVFCSVGSFLWGVFSGTRWSDAQRADIRRSMKWSAVVPVGVVWGVLVIVVPILIWQERYATAYLLGIPIVGMPIAIIGSQYLARRAFRSSVMAASLLTATSVLTVSVMGSTLATTEYLKAGTWAPGARVDIKLKQPTLPLADDVALLTGSTAYVFLWSNAKREVYVLPRDAIEMIRSRPGGVPPTLRMDTPAP